MHLQCVSGEYACKVDDEFPSTIQDSCSYELRDAISPGMLGPVVQLLDVSAAYLRLLLSCVRFR